MDRYTATITIACTGHNCEVQHTGDFTVKASMRRTEQQEVARAHLRTLNWVCGPDGDFCPACHF